MWTKNRTKYLREKCGKSATRVHSHQQYMNKQIAGNIHFKPDGSFNLLLMKSLGIIRGLKMAMSSQGLHLVLPPPPDFTKFLWIQASISSIALSSLETCLLLSHYLYKYLWKPQPCPQTYAAVFSNSQQSTIITLSQISAVQQL